MKSSPKFEARFVAAAAVLLLAACGGGTDDATIGGTVSGLDSGAGLVLVNNGASNLAVSANGSFVFATELSTGQTYDVTVQTQPVGEACSVTNGSGAVDAVNNVTNVAVACVGNASIVGTVAGLASGTSVTLSNGSVLLPIAVNGAFAFPGVLTVGSAYAITVAVQPAGETCTVGNGVGAVPSTDVVSITVACQ